MASAESPLTRDTQGGGWGADDDVRYRAVQARDARFDGWFFVAVTSTGIYCRPSCPSVMPGRPRVRFYPTAAAAQRAGFRACKRCRPDAAPGSPQWAARDDIVARAMRAIADGMVDRQGVTGLASSLGYSPRHLSRVLLAEVGAGPGELARASRAQTARALIESTDIPFSDVAFAAGFGSVRQFNDTVRAVFGEPPMALRSRAKSVVGPERTEGRGARSAGTSTLTPVTLRLAFRPPFASRALFSFLADRAVPGVEAASPSGYRRSLALPHGTGILRVETPGQELPYLLATLLLENLRDLTMAVKRTRQTFDLDCDPTAVAVVLGGCPSLRPALDAQPGLRAPGHVDGAELALRAVLGQHVSVKAARAISATLTARHGKKLANADGDVTTLFPSAETIASLCPADLPVPAARGCSLVRLAQEIASGNLDLSPGADREETSARLARLPGIGPWTVAYIQMRALSDPDVFPAGDLGLRRALGASRGPKSVTGALAVSLRWRPYRSYAAHYLWSVKQQIGAQL